ncbi:hypothetical protein Lal_00039621 [Lupinus albus]|nr:hypothetical protein Lal_00039621 [Lupinus albus]
MAFSYRGSLLQAPPNLYKVLLAFSQPPVAYVVVGIPTCSKMNYEVMIRSFDHPFFENHFGGLPPYTRNIGLPESRVLYTVLRSPHIDKKSREQFEMEIKKKVLVIKTETHELRNASNTRDDSKPPKNSQLIFKELPLGTEWLLEKDWLTFEHRISSTSQGERLPSQAYHRQSKERTGRKRANQILSLLSPS